MRTFTTIALLAAATLTLAAQQEGPTFKATTQIVSVPTTVLDAEGRLVPSLDQDQFTILDNGKPQNITFFQNETQPFTVVVMLDYSASMTNSLDLLRAAAEQFLLRMLPKDKGQVGAFSDRIEFSGQFTNDRDDLISALRDLQYGNPTRLWDAVDQSVDMLKPVEGRNGGRFQTFGDYSRAAGRSHGLRHRTAVGLLQRPANGAVGAGSIAEKDCRGDRRRLFRTEEDRRARANVHTGRAGAAQPVHDRLLAVGARRQGAQAGREDEADRHDRPRTQDLHRIGGAAVEYEFGGVAGPNQARPPVPTLRKSLGRFPQHRHP